MDSLHRLRPNAHWHLLKSWDVLERPCWVFDLRTLPQRLRFVVNRASLSAAEFSHHVDQEMGALIFTRTGGHSVAKVLQKNPLFPGWCPLCWDANPCGLWNKTQLEQEGYGSVPRKIVASAENLARYRMSLDPGASQKQVLERFRKLALEQHPDHGGSNAAIQQLIQDRDVLLRCSHK
jgi:hypothetical protein